MALSHVQSCSAIAKVASSTTATVSFGSNVTAGNAVVVLVHQYGTSNRTHTVTDSAGATYTKLYDPGGTNQGPEFWICANHPGGTTPTVTVTADVINNYSASAAEFSGFDGSASLVGSDWYTDPGVTDNHQASASGLTYATECLALIAGGSLLGTNLTNSTALGGYAKMPSGYTDVSIFFAWDIFPSGCTAELGRWDSTGTDRQAMAGIILLAASGGGGGGTAQVIGGGWFGA